MIRQPFHLVTPSPWPILGGVRGLLITLRIVALFHGYPLARYLGPAAATLTGITIYQWWRDVCREATIMGNHTFKVVRGLKWGIILFIISEVIFFFGFFWAFFHSSLAPTPNLGCCWPPTGVDPINPFRIPLLNTATLLASGVTVTWAHHSLLLGLRLQTAQCLIITVGLGVYFTILQAGEYIEAPFTIADRVYGSTFFVTTGFHGVHVLIGSTFLTICTLRVIIHQFSPTHHFGFEAAAWYWHFVDVVWIGLFITIYWWGA